jgi:hypothetical protein
VEIYINFELENNFQMDIRNVCCGDADFLKTYAPAIILCAFVSTMA